MRRKYQSINQKHQLNDNLALINHWFLLPLLRNWQFLKKSILGFSNVWHSGCLDPNSPILNKSIWIPRGENGSKWLANDSQIYVSLPTSSKWWGIPSAEFVTIHCPGFVAVIGPTKPPCTVFTVFLRRVRLQKKGCGTQWGWEKTSLQSITTTLHQLGSCRTSLRKFRLPLEYTSSIRNIEEHTKFRITGQKHFTLGVINPIWYTALRAPGLFFLHIMTIHFKCWNSRRFSWELLASDSSPTQFNRDMPVDMTMSIFKMRKWYHDQTIRPNASPLRDTGIWIYKASSSANIFLRREMLFLAGWMCVTWSAHMFKPTNVQQNWHVRTTAIASQPKKETVLDDY